MKFIKIPANKFEKGYCFDLGCVSDCSTNCYGDCSTNCSGFDTCQNNSGCLTNA
ncbi:MAG: Clo7bot family Cys-rich peptide [Paraclostridium bifermentans]|nr:Clo7bot family Cys-rich peptide [Paraclostridium bifermentans]